MLDFVLLEDEGDTVLKLMMVTERQSAIDESAETLLTIREYPSFNVLFELQVNLNKIGYCRLRRENGPNCCFKKIKYTFVA